MKYNIIAVDKDTEPSVEKRKNRSVTLTYDTHKDLNALKEEKSKKMGGRVTFSMVTRALLNEHENLEQVKQGVEESKAYLQEMLKLSLSQSRSVVVAGGIGTSNLASKLSAPPPPPSVKKPPIKKVSYVNTANLKKNFSNEIRQVFDPSRKPMKPSEIKALANPQFAESKRKELSEEELQERARQNEEILFTKRKFKTEAVSQRKDLQMKMMNKPLNKKEEFKIAQTIQFMENLLLNLNSISIDNTIKLIKENPEVDEEFVAENKAIKKLTKIDKKV